MSVVDMKFREDQDIGISNLRSLLFRRERELRELHHRIANSLQLASSFLVFQQKQNADPRVKGPLDAAAARLAAVGKIHRHLYAHSEDSEVDFKQFLEELCPEIAQSTGLGCVIRADPVMISGEMAQQLAIVINEFALNAGKHAYGGQPGGTLKIECRREGARLRLTVADGGKGLGEGFDPNGGKGLGMTLVSAIVQQLNGTLTAEDDHGARFTVTAPLA